MRRTAELCSCVTIYVLRRPTKNTTLRWKALDTRVMISFALRCNCFGKADNDFLNVSQGTFMSVNEVNNPTNVNMDLCVAMVMDVEL